MSKELKESKRIMSHQMEIIKKWWEKHFLENQLEILKLTSMTEMKMHWKGSIPNLSKQKKESTTLDFIEIILSEEKEEKE